MVTRIFDSSLTDPLKPPPPPKNCVFKISFGLGFPQVFMKETTGSTLWQSGLHVMDEATVFPD